jgi:hypothetical protein
MRRNEANQISDRKRLANQRNAQKSTGPKTPEGKARSKMNAMIHGVFCQEIVILKEHLPLYRELRREIIRDLRPQNTIELAMVDKIIECQWRLRRLRVSESVEHDLELRDYLKEKGESYDEEMKTQNEFDYCAPVALGYMMDRESSGLEQYSRYEQRMQNMVHRCLRELRMLREMQKEIEKLPPSPFEETVDEVKYRWPTGWEDEKKKMVSDTISVAEKKIVSDTISVAADEDKIVSDTIFVAADEETTASVDGVPVLPAVGSATPPSQEAIVRNEATEGRRYDADVTCAPDHEWFYPPPAPRYTAERDPERT